MSDFIEDFYYRNIVPQQCTTKLISKVKKLCDLVAKEEQLTSLLNGQSK